MLIRRTRASPRSRCLQIVLFVTIYTCYYAYSLAVPPIDNAENEPFSTGSTLDEKPVESSTKIEVTSESTFIETTTHHKHHNFLRPPRDNCTPPAIEQFPPTLMSQGIRKHGGLIIHIAAAMFTFLGLAIVCDDYFVSSLDRICEELQLSPDVAGATFMAAGSSAPELATVIIGVFFAKDDIGVSGVIGSAVFNIMFVISVCCLCSGTVASLNWWPLVRDCVFYSISILIMLIVMMNRVISWPEALFMLLCYVGYCVALKFNTEIERIATPYILRLPIKLPSREEQSSLVTFKNAADTSYTRGIPDDLSPTSPQQELSQRENDTSIYDPNSSWDPNGAWDDGSAKASAAAKPAGANGAWSSGYNDDWGDGTGQSYGEEKKEPAAVTTTTALQNSNDLASKNKEPRPEMPNPLIKPVNADILTLAYWHIVFPIHFLCRNTMVDVKQEEYKNCYIRVFLISMVWISFFSYIMVWMITIIGFTLGIPDTVMGLTFVAAGVSVPDALSSIAVIKDGYGDMAVSNAVGSNVFDILVCLGLPWFIQTAMIAPGSHVNVISKGLAYSTLSLFTTVLFLLFAVHMNNWKLDKKLGFILMFWYLFFIILASLYELNFFGYMNPPECASAY